MRKMGGLRKYMPITWITMWIGTLALIGTPFFSGFYSKDTIIEAAAHHAHTSHHWIATYGYWAVLAGVFVTSFYSFRLLYLTFHGRERFRDAEAHGHGDHAHEEHVPVSDSHHGGHADDESHAHHGPVEPHESPWVVTVPLILLAIPSVLIGFLTVGPMLFGDFFTGSIQVNETPEHLKAISALAHEFPGTWYEVALGMVAHSFKAWPLYLAFAGFALATFLYLVKPELPGRMRAHPVGAFFTRILDNKYGMDDLWIKGFAGGGVALGKSAWKYIDAGLIDGVLVNGTAWIVDRVAGLVRHVQSGYLYHYAFAMILGLIVLLAMLSKMVGG